MSTETEPKPNHNLRTRANQTQGRSMSFITARLRSTATSTETTPKGRKQRLEIKGGSKPRSGQRGSREEAFAVLVIPSIWGSDASETPCLIHLKPLHISCRDKITNPRTRSSPSMPEKQSRKLKLVDYRDDRHRRCGSRCAPIRRRRRTTTIFTFWESKRLGKTLCSLGL